MATIPTHFSHGIIRKLQGELRKNGILPDLTNATISLIAAHPVVEVKCRSHFFLAKEARANISYVQDNNSQTVLANLSILAGQVRGPGMTKPLFDTYTDGMTQQQSFPPLWMPSPEAGSTSLLGVFFSWRYRANETTAPSLDWILTKGAASGLDIDRRLSIQACTISAFWTTSEVKFVTARGSGEAERMQTGLLSNMQYRDVIPVTLDPTCLDANQSMELHALYLYTNEIILASAFTVAISEHPRNALSVDYINPKGSDPRNAFAVTFTTTIFGFGYGITSISVKLSFATIFAYCIITVSYILYILITGSTSTAWCSAVELVALALQSKRPVHLEHTSVGIDSLKTFKQGVGIRINKEDRLELVFEGDREMRELRKIEKNKAY
jgi:hypothetical protein